jgi:hypothetical protein
MAIIGPGNIHIKRSILIISHMRTYFTSRPLQMVHDDGVQLLKNGPQMAR